MRTVALVLVTVILTACTPGSAEPGPPPATHVRQGGDNGGSNSDARLESSRECQTPRILLELGDERVFPVLKGQVLRFTIHVDDVMRVRVTGNCARSVGVGVETDVYRSTCAGCLRAVSDHPVARLRSFQAVRPGVVDLAMSMPQCARAPIVPPGRVPCFGGLSMLGSALVTVLPSSN